MSHSDEFVLRALDPLCDAVAAHGLWAAGGPFPLDPCVFARFVSGRESYRPGDALVAERWGCLIGIALAECPRRADGWASVSLVLVHPGERRRGVGAALLAGLEERLVRRGVRQVQAGGSLWPGVPEAPGAVELFRRAGYGITDEWLDLVVPLAGFEAADGSSCALAAAGATTCPLSPADLSATLEYQLREFPWWVDPLLEMLPQDMSDVVLVKREREVIGCAMAFTPQSRGIGAGLQRQRESDWCLGALGAVGIAAAWRGRGLGRALCEAGVAHIRQAGGTHVYVEQVEPHVVPFYEKMGGAVYARSWLVRKALPD